MTDLEKLTLSGGASSPRAGGSGQLCLSPFWYGSLSGLTMTLGPHLLKPSQQYTHSHLRPRTVVSLGSVLGRHGIFRAATGLRECTPLPCSSAGCPMSSCHGTGSSRISRGGRPLFTGSGVPSDSRSAMSTPSKNSHHAPDLQPSQDGSGSFCS